jgi:hypothetical protein
MQKTTKPLTRLIKTDHRSSSLNTGYPHLGRYYDFEQSLSTLVKVVPIINGAVGCFEEAGYWVNGILLNYNGILIRRRTG